MAYGLKYRLTQALRDGTSLVANIYEKDYVLTSVIDYEAVSIQLNSNASGDEPLAAIVSSQLNVSFIVSDSNSTNFPDLLNFDVRKYFIKLVNGSDLLWCGFLFNDYVQVPFTTGYVQVDIIAIDGLSFLENSTFNFIENININSTARIIDLIAETLNVIALPDPIFLFTAISYYAEGMFDRSDASGDDPLTQSYIYRRDIQNKTYYEVLENIVKSFGCRLFQSDGKWQFIAINEMCDTTRYYSEYAIYPSVSLANSGTFNKNITIEPYAESNVHFVNNSQTKIVRKGYPKLNLNYNFSYPSTYLHNGTFKGLQDYIPAFTPTSICGWYLYNSLGYTYSNTVDIRTESNFNNVNLIAPIGGNAYLQNVPPSPLSPILYAPYMVGPFFTVSLEHIIPPTRVGKIEVRLVRGSTSYYYNSSNAWQTTQTYLTIDNPFTYDTYRDEFNSYSLSVNMTYPSIPLGVGLQWGGYVIIKIFVEVSTDHPSIIFRNVKISQGSFRTNNVLVTRQIGDTNSNIKELEQPYGTYAEFLYTDNVLLTNNLGVLYNSSGDVLKNWYRYPNTESFPLLQMLIARQYSNLLNKNFGTLEGDLGSFKTAKGLNYLDKLYTITDPSTTPLSYNGKKFLMNRATVIPQTNEIDSLQVIEITNVDNDSTEIVKYIDE